MPPRLATRVSRAIPAGPARILVVNALVGTFGSGLFYAGNVMYFTRVIGLSAWEVSLGISIAGAAGLVAAMPIAALADRIGFRPTLVALHLLRAAVYLAYLWVDDFTGFLVLVCVIGVADKASYPLTQALVGSLFDGAARTKTMAVMRATQNIGMSGGALAAAAVLTVDLRTGFLLLTAANGLSFVFTASQLWRIRPAADAVEAAAALPEVAEPAARVGRWRHLGLSGLNGVLSLHDTVLFVALPLWLASDKDAPTAMVSIVLAINTVLTAAGQVWWTRFTRTVPQAAWAAVAAGALLAGSSLTLCFVGIAGPIVTAVLVSVAAVLLTLGENLHAAAAWEISFALSPSDARGSYLAMFGLGQSARDVCGPAAVTALVSSFGPYGWALLGVTFVLGGAGFRRSTLRLVERQRLAREQHTRGATAPAAPAAH
ncbi:MFS transporter [Micromonospora sp. NPDC048935]|uniref:MFS transporter n=1 Tax=Micromonospora sp. NPDC048935 TaxID=3364262 RepID=UPI0037212ECF